MRGHKSAAETRLGRGPEHSAGQSTAWVILAVFLAAAALVTPAVLPMALVLPALSAVMVMVGFVLAGGLYLSGSRMGRNRSGAWDVAGALVFLGFAAALLTDVEQALTLLERMQTPS